MMIVRPSHERGHFNRGWLDSYFTFSFAEYHDRNQMGFRSLRVINEDRFSPTTGFGTHPHQDMEIITYVLDGELEHRDSMDRHSVIRPGDVQHITAGTGITHSEYNHSQAEAVHLLQIWIMPDERGLAPSYEERTFPAEGRRGTWQLIARKHPGGEAIHVNQDVSLYATVLEAGEELSYDLKPGRHAWLQMARGAVTLNGTPLRQGDGVAVSEEERLTVTARADAEVLLFDLA